MKPAPYRGKKPKHRSIEYQERLLNDYDDPVEHLEREPRLQLAREASLMAHGVVIKLKEMGLPEDLDNELAQLCTDLGDLWSAQKRLAEQFESFVDSDREWIRVGDQLVDLRASIDHMAWHMKNVRRPMTAITRYAYSQDQTEQEA